MKMSTQYNSSRPPNFLSAAWRLTVSLDQTYPMQTMSSRNLIVLSISLLLSVIVAIFFVDRPLALWIDANLHGVQPVFVEITHYTELLTGFPISKFLPAFVALSIGIGFHVITRSNSVARYFYFVGLTFLFSRIVAGTLKNVFLRSRPVVLLKDHEMTNTFFVDEGNSFPSGHTAHYWGLLLPLAFLFPKFRITILAVATLLSLGRVIVNDHYLGDILASGLIALWVCIIFKKLFVDRFEIKPVHTTS